MLIASGVIKRLIISGLCALVAIACVYATNHLRLDREKIITTLQIHYGDRASKRGQAWLNLLNSSYSSEQQKLQRTNQFFNQLRFTTDKQLWGVNNYWATPLEFIGVNAGDCEDFALAKYFTLLELGVEDKKLRIVMVKALTLNQYHMVLAYYQTPVSEPLILDNIVGQIRPAGQRKDLVPIYSFNGKQLWLNKEKSQGVLAGKPSRLKRWNDLNQRMGLKELKQPIVNME